jgi:hypothetical protein
MKRKVENVRRYDSRAAESGQNERRRPRVVTRRLTRKDLEQHFPVAPDQNEHSERPQNRRKPRSVVTEAAAKSQEPRRDRQNKDRDFNPRILDRYSQHRQRNRQNDAVDSTNR